MPTKTTTDAHLAALSHNVSDLLVGLNCLDITEVAHEATMLKERAKEYGLSLLELTAHNIEQAAVAGNIEAAQLLIPELHERLQQVSSLTGQSVPLT